MIDSFLAVAYDESVKIAEQDALVEAMKKLPVEVLYKLASGGQELSIKTGTGLEWLEQFKDTPLFQKAVELEQQCIQIEVARQAQCEKDSAMRENEPKYWEMEQKLHLQKKLLGLELAMSQLQQQQGGAAGAPNPMSPPPPGPSAPAGEQGAGAMGNDGPPKVASVEEKKMASEQVTLAISMGQKLAHSDARRADQFQAGRGLGEIMAKTAEIIDASPEEIAELRPHIERMQQHLRHSALKGSVAGGVGGALLGGAAGAATAKTQGFGLPLALLGGLAGAGGGAMLGRKAGLHLGESSDKHESNMRNIADVAGRLGRARFGEGGPVATAEISKGAAFDPKMLASLGQKAVGAFEKNPMATLGGAMGAVGGLAHGMKKDEHGQRHLGAGLAEGLAGGAAGAAAGHVAGGAHSLMGQGLSPTEALGTASRALGNQALATGRNVASQVQPAAEGLMGRIKPMLGG